MLVIQPTTQPVTVSSCSTTARRILKYILKTKQHYIVKGKVICISFASFTSFISNKSINEKVYSGQHNQVIAQHSQDSQETRYTIAFRQQVDWGRQISLDSNLSSMQATKQSHSPNRQSQGINVQHELLSMHSTNV